jgi:YVTN family beta-propeller protein
VDSFPNSIAITVDGKQAYVGNEGSNTVSVIDTATNTVTSTLTGLNSPRGVAARPVPPGIAVPNVVGATQSAATAAISGAGLSVGTVSQQASLAVAPGSVISENPAAGTLLGGGAKIDIEISSGVSVPDVLEMPQALAVNAITAAGLVVGHITQQSSGTVEAGGVISQSPALGTAVAGGSAVDLVISTGPTRNGGGGGIDSLTLTGLLALLAIAWARQEARAQCRGPGDDELDFPSKK